MRAPSADCDSIASTACSTCAVDDVLSITDIMQFYGVRKSVKPHNPACRKYGERWYFVWRDCAPPLATKFVWGDRRAKSMCCLSRITAGLMEKHSLPTSHSLAHSVTQLNSLRPPAPSQRASERASAEMVRWLTPDSLTH